MNQMQQPKPESMSYSDLISEIRKGEIKVPKFQRDFVWSIGETAKLLDSILKGYPIGTFILWKTAERMNAIKNIGNLELPDPPEGAVVKYVLDGQQRITSLYAAYLGANIPKFDEKGVVDYSQIFVNLSKDIESDEDQIVTSSKPEDVHISLSDVLNWSERRKVLRGKYSEIQREAILDIEGVFKHYEFSTVLLRKDDIVSAIEVFTRINTGGKTLTLFEIMTARTYDEARKFDMSDKWAEFQVTLQQTQYTGISNSVILHLISLILSPTKECKRNTILKLDKTNIINIWDEAIRALKASIDYFRSSLGIPVSKLIPYDSLLVPFSYFRYHNKNLPDSMQEKYLFEFFWRASLSERYSASTESRLAQDIKRMDLIVEGKRPTYDDMKTHIQGPDDLINTEFRVGASVCKAVLCLLASQGPMDFQNSAKVILDNSFLIQANSKNYHHFFPISFLKRQKVENFNSLVNITFISDWQNKRVIGARAPSDYVTTFAKQNSTIHQALQSHFIELNNFGIQNDSYSIFLKRRAERIYKEIAIRLEPK